MEIILSFCSKFIKKTVYQILLESPEFCRKYYKKTCLSLFWTHCIFTGNFCTLHCISCAFLTVFTALHAMQTRSSDEKANVCLSVRPSVCQTRGLRQNGRKICPDFYVIRKII